MQKFELGFAYRGTSAPEVKQVVEANSIREAMLEVIERHGGDDVILVTHAHYLPTPEPSPPSRDDSVDQSPGPTPFLLVPK